MGFSVVVELLELCSRACGEENYLRLHACADSNTYMLRGSCLQSAAGVGEHNLVLLFVYLECGRKASENEYTSSQIDGC